MHQDIIPQVDTALIESELTQGKFVKHTNNGDNLVYIVSVHDSPHTMLEIGRLREFTFREAGGGTGRSFDIDDFDKADKPFFQLIVWNPEEKEIIGGYRFIHGKDIRLNKDRQPLSPMGEIFHFSDHFIRDYLPVSIELGRSWVQPKYQPSNDFRKGIYSLDNLWDGLGALVNRYPDVQYFFGKMTMYTTFNAIARDLILGFLQIYFPDNVGLMRPFRDLTVQPAISFEKLLHHFKGNDYDHDYKLLVRFVRHYGEQVPALFNAYMNLSKTMKTFGTAVNPHFGDVEETGILICIADIYPEKKERHIKE